jgi:fluoride ion exporter CrcB/FEX
MPSTAITCGILLILIGLGGFGFAATTLPPGTPVTKVITALIPAILGLILAVLGFFAKSKENLRKHLMHAAVMVGLLGFLATVSSFLKLPALFDGTAERPLAVISQLLTAIICLVFVILCVKSFIDARRSGAV